MINSKAKSSKRISDIFLKFASPICEGISGNLAPEEYQKALLVPMAVWNAVNLKHWGKSADYVKDIIAEIAKHDSSDKEATTAMIQTLVQRKNELFPDELWCIRDVIAYRDFNGELIIRVVAVAPEQFKDQLPTHELVDGYRSNLN